MAERIRGRLGPVRADQLLTKRRTCLEEIRRSCGPTYLGLRFTHPGRKGGKPMATWTL